MTDIKQTLATAFEDEPPLTIDRAAILRSGRRKAIFRRGCTGAAVLATVAAVCVPAMLGSGGGGGVAQVGAGGSSTTAPVGSSAPASSTAATGSTPSSATGGPSTTGVTTPPDRTSFQPEPPPKPTSPRRAAELTSLLASSGVIPADARSARYADYPAGPWEFAADAAGYEAIADVTTAAGRGRVMVNLGGGEGPRCDPGLNTAKSTCELKVVDGQPVVVLAQTSDDLHPVTLVSASLRKADGTVVEVSAMNGNVEKTGLTGPNPPLTVEQLVKIATLPGLTF
ncbi:hypothetical protein [Saccharothrix hoggarensis]|uniref:Uncharacterized protein n=1 Tax=Saccharothrix hoggarensis TaxID=913853 RepID=A0ABW3QVU7_9PSEU